MGGVAVSNLTCRDHSYKFGSSRGVEEGEGVVIINRSVESRYMVGGLNRCGF